MIASKANLTISSPTRQKYIRHHVDKYCSLKLRVDTAKINQGTVLLIRE